MIYVIMTALDEATALQSLLPCIPSRLHGHDVRAIVVDDGSHDGTFDVARRHGCITLRSEVNQGKGASLRLAFEYLNDIAVEAIVLMDADGQHDPMSLSDLTRPIVERTADIVVGSRYLTTTGRSGTPLNRYAVRTVTVQILNRQFGIRCTDPYSGFRCLSPDALANITLCGDRYESELETLFCAKRRGLTLVERPVPKIYGPSSSKMGARGGMIVGRTMVVTGYAKAILDAARHQKRDDMPLDVTAISS